MPVLNYPLSVVMPDDYVATFVEQHNDATNLINQLVANFSTGAVGTPGTVNSLASNFNKNIADDPTQITLANWTFYFSSTKSLISIPSLSVDMTQGTAMPIGVHYLYINDAGQAVITNAAYTTYTPNLARVLRIEFDTDYSIYSLIIMPELASTPKLLRSFIRSEPMLKVVDAVITANANLTLSRTSTRYFTEGIGVYGAVDENILDVDNEAVVDLVYASLTNQVPEPITYGSDLNVTRYINYATDIPNDGPQYATRQLCLSYDGKLIVQFGPTLYASLAEAATELPFEHFERLVGDNVGEYIPIARIAVVNGATDLSDPTKAFILNLTQENPTSRYSIWYSK